MNCIISRNKAHNTSVSLNAAARGGGLFSAGGLKLRNCLIVQNEALHASGAAAYESGDGVAVGGGIYNAGSLTVRNSLLYGNYVRFGAGVEIYEHGDGVNGCISKDPLFEGPATHNFKLDKSSPCKNTGVNIPSWMIGALDLAGSTRVLGSIVDMGAYESPAPAGTILTLF